MIFTNFFVKTREFKGNMPVLRAFPFSVKLQCDSLVSHSGVTLLFLYYCKTPVFLQVSQTYSVEGTASHIQKDMAI